MKILRKIIYRIASPVIWLASSNKLVEALQIFSATEKLEREKKYLEAYNLRQKWLSKLPTRVTAPIWRQEGNYQLYREKNYAKSLNAFENASKGIDLGPSTLGVADPIQIYYGATVSSIHLEFKEKAEHYFKKLMQTHDKFTQSPELKESLTAYSDGINWIREKLNKKDNK